MGKEIEQKAAAVLRQKITDALEEYQRETQVGVSRLSVDMIDVSSPTAPYPTCIVALVHIDVVR